MARKATLTEIETMWSLTDLLDCHDAMDLEQEAERRAHEASKPKKGGR